MTEAHGQEMALPGQGLAPDRRTSIHCFSKRGATPPPEGHQGDFKKRKVGREGRPHAGGPAGSQQPGARAPRAGAQLAPPRRDGAPRPLSSEFIIQNCPSSQSLPGRMPVLRERRRNGWQRINTMTRVSVSFRTKQRPGRPPGENAGVGLECRRPSGSEGVGIDLAWNRDCCRGLRGRVQGGEALF